MSELPAEIDIYGMMVQCREQIIYHNLGYPEIEKNMIDDGIDKKTAKRVIAGTKKMVRDKEFCDQVTYYTTMMARYMKIYESSQIADPGTALKALNEHRKCHFLLSQLL